ncbi:MAG TPA: GTP pyrophosphokinase, partial [Streptosporangiaceae bacterium]|nr:GTP pyrophosphokinase [Streptosporangiaceae bacterium]
MRSTVAGDVITTGTRAADPARMDAPRGSDPVTDAEQAEAGAPDVPGDRTADDTAQAPEGPEGPEGPAGPKASEDLADDTAPPRQPQAASTGSTQARTSRARAAVAAVQGQAADVAASGVGVRRRLARLGAQRGNTFNPVLDPLIKTVRATHPKADVRLIERAYDQAAYWHREQKRLSGDPFIT